jgi:hypothetical protein
VSGTYLFGCGEAGVVLEEIFLAAIDKASNRRKDSRSVVTAKNVTSGMLTYLTGKASINSHQYPGLGRAQQNGCSDLLGLVQCIDVLYARSKLGTMASSGVTQTVFRAQSLPCSWSKCLLGSGSGAPQGGSFPSNESSDIIDGEHLPSTRRRPVSREAIPERRVRAGPPSHGTVAQTRTRITRVDDARIKPSVLLSSKAIAGGLMLFRVLSFGPGSPSLN